MLDNNTGSHWIPDDGSAPQQAPATLMQGGGRFAMVGAAPSLRRAGTGTIDALCVARLHDYRSYGSSL